jgi:hypothetical protein
MIRIRGARTHNLKNIDLDIPRDRLIVITGLSGSGKSSLAFDTIYAEGQRRYVESLSAYARQFLSMMEKPDVDHIDGLSPAISIEQKSTSHNPRSTVGTMLAARRNSVPPGSAFPRPPFARRSSASPLCKLIADEEATFPSSGGGGRNHISRREGGYIQAGFYGRKKTFSALPKNDILVAEE